MQSVSNPNGQPETSPAANRLPEAGGAAVNPFDPARFRLSQDFASSIGVKKVLTTVPCRKPNRHEYVRVRLGEDWRLETGIFEDKINRENYLVDPSLWEDLLGELHPVCLFYAVTRQGTVFLWPVKLPSADGRSNSWNESALDAARLAESKWVKVSANMSAGMYDVFEARGDLADPEWPDLPFPEVLRLAFKTRYIETVDHPTLKALRGEV